MEQTKITKYVNQNDIFPFNFDTEEMNKCETDFDYFYNQYYSVFNPEITLEEFNEHISTIKNPNLVIFRWCLGRIKRK
jgi:hypothetical protein